MLIFEIRDISHELSSSPVKNKPQKIKVKVSITKY